MFPTPVVPPWVPPTEKIDRPTASAINNSAPTRDAQTLTVAGFNQPIPVCYGEDRIGGVFLAGPIVDSNGGLVFAIGWSVADTTYGIEGVQTVYMDGAITTHEGSGVNQRYIVHYNGTQTTVDPVLAVRFTAFADKFEGIAYTAFRIPARSTGGYPRIEALVRGRRVLDPRTATWAWTRNPGLCMRDFIINPQWGLGMTVRGAEAVADRCDSLVSGQPRCQMGLTITTVAQASVHLDTLSAYAECLWGFDGDGVLLVPDAPVIAPVLTLREMDIKDGTLRLTGANLSQSPTSVTVRRLAPTSSAEAWREESSRVALPGVDDGLIDDIPSDVSMPGVHRASEATRKAGMRLRRLQMPGQVAFQMHDNGISIEKGDVIAMPPDFRGLAGQTIRILANQMVERGLYQLTAELYSASMYDDVPAPSEGAVIPVGGIIPVFTGGVPAGFERWSAADGRFLMGGGTSGAQGGNETYSFTAATDARGLHSGTEFYGPTATGATGTVAGVGGGADGVHTHTVPVTLSLAGNGAPPFRTMSLIKKTGAPDQVPPNCSVLAPGTLLTNTMLETADFNGRLIKSGAVAANGGATFPRNVNASTTFNGAHSHRGTPRAGKAGTSLYETGPSTAGNHAHVAALTLVYTPRTMTLALYTSVVSSYVPIGAIIGWELSSGPIPSGWRLCDGTAGTVNLVDAMPVLSSVADAGRRTGNNSLTASGIAQLAGKHSHGTTAVGYEDLARYMHSNETGEHIHTVSGQLANVLPPYHTLLFIQYFGV